MHSVQFCVKEKERKSEKHCRWMDGMYFSIGRRRFRLRLFFSFVSFLFMTCSTYLTSNEYTIYFLRVSVFDFGFEGLVKHAEHVMLIDMVGYLPHTSVKAS